MSIKRFLADLPLRRKLMLIIMIVVLVATGTTLLFLRQQAAQARSEQFVQHALAQARLVAEYAVSPLVFDDSQGAGELLTKLALDQRVRYVRIDDERGKVFAEISRGQQPAPMPALQGEQPWQLQQDMLHVAVPIVHQKPLGHLRVGFRLDELQQTLGQEQRFLLLVLIGVIALSYLLTLFLQRIISTPLLELQKHANRLAETQDFSMRLKPPGRDEVGSLYRAFNHLIERIRQREDDILALNRSLETKVAERTHDLEIARDKADQASLSKSEFLANMSHEIRTPINAITGFTALALRTELDTKQAGYLERIHTATQGLLRIINDLLDFSKIEAGYLDMEHIPFRLAEVMEAVVSSIDNQAERKGLELLIRVAPEVPPQLLGDPLRLGQVLINLCNNAVKFTEQGEVEVRVALQERIGDDARLLFSVRDTGIGLTPEQAGKLFQAFTQADTSITRKFGGTGLGLVISQRLVQMMDGRIWLESQPGTGTTFFFEVQLSLEPAGDARPAALLPEDLRGKPALVVDDNANARQILVAQLASLGMDARAVDSGEAALEALRQASAGGRPYPLVLMDWKMPGIDGITATRAIRADPTIAGTPVVIMVTAYGREQSIGAPENAALFESVLLKPVTPELLAETLCRAMGAASDGAAMGRQASLPLTGRLPGVRLLLVEDNPINQQLAQELLEQEGAEVQIADNGRSGLEALQRAGLDYFDAVLLDLQMPEMDGYEAARRIRQLPQGERLPLIAMTAHAMLEERERCLAAGMNDHVAKPIDLNLLIARLAKWIGADKLAQAELRQPQAVAQDAPATVKTGPALPATLPGVDIAAGVQRCMGDAQLFRDLLIEFRRHHDDTAQQMAQLCTDRKYTDLAFFAHKLKGAAANLNINGIVAVTVQLEEALHAERYADLPPLLVRLAGILATVNAGLAALDETESAVAVDDRDWSEIQNREDLQALVRELATCLRHNDTRAEQLLADMRALLVLLSGTEPGWLTAVAAAVNALEYEAALECLRDAGLERA